MAPKAFLAPAFRLSVLHESAESAKCCVPVLGNQVQVVARVLQAFLVQSPDVFAPLPRTVRQACLLHHHQVLCDCLAGEVATHS